MVALFTRNVSGKLIRFESACPDDEAAEHIEAMINSVKQQLTAEGVQFGTILALIHGGKDVQKV